MTDADRISRLVAVTNALSDEAVYICTRDWFSQVLVGKPVLAAPRNAAQEKVFTELLGAGLVHGDVERGVFGYRSTYDGRDVAALCHQSFRKEPERD